MDWIRPDFPYAKVEGPKELSYESRSVRENDLIRTEIVIKNDGKKPYFTNQQEIRISFPLPDQYEDSTTSLTKRCHAHIFCGKEVSWICALRMGGEAPHLGMVLTEGSLAGYSVRRNLVRQSNDRGCFYLHPEAMQLMPGESRTISWVIFPHQGKTDFLKQVARLGGRFVEIRANRYVLYPGEPCVVTIRPAFDAGTVLADGKKLEKTCVDGTVEYRYPFTAGFYGEQEIEICVDSVRTVCRVFVQEQPEVLAEKRCLFLAAHQQCLREGMLKGAYLAYDNEEGHLIYTPENDFNGGRERMGMGVLMAKFLQKKRPGAYPKLEESLQQYMEYVRRELVEEKSGKVCNDAGMDDSYRRLYNLPWACTLFLEVYRLWKKEEDLLCSVRILEYFYADGGTEFYPIQLPVKMIMEELKKAGWKKEYDQLLKLFIRHADRLCRYGIHYPGSEVNYEQSIVAPAADVLLAVYQLTGEQKYLEEGSRQVKILELFNGMQPDYHMHEVAVRHWDGYWFGKRRFYGDTFPHYWSALTGSVFQLYGEITGDETWLRRAEDSRRGVLPLFFRDGSASCAYVYPMLVNDRQAAFFDPYANDQDWGLYYNLGNCSR